MTRVRQEPGDYIPYNVVKEKLTAPAYGAIDLVDLKLFHSEHFVRDAIASGKLKAQKINRRAIVLCKEEILQYWEKHRNEPYEPAENVVNVKFTISELDYICSLVDQAKKRLNKDFCFNDLFRNIIKYMISNKPSIDNYPHLFVKN